MPLIPAPPAVPNKDTLPLRLERELHAQLRDYAEFLGSSKEYIVTAALRRVFRHDKDFLAWQQARQGAVKDLSTTKPTLSAPLTADKSDAPHSASPEVTRKPTGKDRS